MFYTCGPNEAMVVSGKVSSPSLPTCALMPQVRAHRRTRDQALVKSVDVPGLMSAGLCRSPPLMIAGGRVFVIPCIQQIQRLALQSLGNSSSLVNAGNS